jgi:MFS transporter, putative metabolite:H+ symporter
MNHRKSYIFMIVALATIGYFVNIYIVTSFNMVGPTILKDVTGHQEMGVTMLSVQMLGALIGSFFWGVIGDRQGRMSALFASTLLCAVSLFFTCFLEYLPNDPDYIKLIAFFILIFCVGFGLAGEIGADMTLVSEVMHTDANEPKQPYHKHRIWATTIVVAFGALGGLLAGEITKPGEWKTTYYWGAGLSLLLVLARISVYGSNLFRLLKYDKPDVVRGNWRYLFSDKTMRHKLFVCTFIALPIWFVLGILLKKPEDFGYISPLLGDAIRPSNIYFWSYFGLSVGCFVAGIWAWKKQSYKQPLIGFLCLGFLSISFYLLPILKEDPSVFRLKCFLLGIGRGYWGMFVAIVPTYFGTNLRCTATTISINAIRGFLGLYALIIWFASEFIMPKIAATWILSIVLIGVSLYVAVKYFEETYHKDLDFED